jgi:type II secretion system protein H
MLTRRQHGFTLIEMLVTLLIMLAILTVAVPQFSAGLKKLQLRKCTQEISALLRQARNVSVTQARVAAVVLDEDKRTLQSDTGSKRYQWPGDIEVTSVDDTSYLPAETTTIHFYPDGTATSAVLTVSAQERSYTITIDWLTGKVGVL